jgi:type II secretory pathway component PulK
VNGRRVAAGTSLIEVLIALALAATAASGTMGAQWYALQSLRATHAHLRAALIADSTIELLRVGVPDAAVSARLRERAARELMSGTGVVSGPGGAVRRVELRWSDPLRLMPDMGPTACETRAAARAAQCLTVWFAR